MSYANKKFHVWLKKNWGNNWIPRPDIEPITCSQTVNPNVGKAEFVIRYGSGIFENAQALTSAENAQSFGDWYIQITAADDDAGSNAEAYWTGIIPAEQFNLLGQAGGVKTADQKLVAYSLEFLLDRRMSGAWVREDAATAVKQIDRLPIFNRVGLDGEVIGNRSDNRHQFNNSGGTAFSTYVFDASADRPVWSYAAIIEYIANHFGPDITRGGPQFYFNTTTAISDALDQMVGVFDFSQVTLRQALDILISRSRGFCWFTDTDTAGNVVIAIRSMLDEAVTIGDVTIPGHDVGDRVVLNLWTDPAHTDVVVTKDQGSTYSTITVRGSGFKAVGTFQRGGDGPLDQGWTAAELILYKDAAKNTEGYDALSNAEKSALNDKYRSADKFDRVLTTLVLDSDFDWTIAGEILNPQYDPTTGKIKLDAGGALVQAEYWNSGHRFLSLIPFLGGVDYGDSPAVDNNPAGTVPEYRRPFCLVKGADGKYLYVDKAPHVTATVRPLTTEPGIEVKFKPAYLFSNSWSAEPGLWDDDLAEYGYSNGEALFTCMIQLDAEFKVQSSLNNNESDRELVIDIPDAEIWWVTPGTIVDVDDAGDPVEFKGITTSAGVPSADPSANLVRDDSDKLQAVLAAAVAFYGRPRYKVQITNRVLIPLADLGAMLDNIDIAVGSDDPPGTVITSISTDFRSSVLTIQTDHAELDLAGIYGSRQTSATPAIPNLKVASREINKTNQRLSDLERQTGKNPLRVMSGYGDTRPVRRAFCKTAAQAATTIVCFLDTDGTGDEITVNCEIIGGPQLNDAIPLLQVGTEIKVIKSGGNWYCLSPFQAVGVGFGFSGAVVKVAVDTDQFKFDGNNLQTTMQEC